MSAEHGVVQLALPVTNRVRGRWLWAGLAALLVVAVLAVAAVLLLGKPLAARSVPARPEPPLVLTGNGQAMVSYAPAPAAAAISEDEAIRRAGLLLTAPETASAVFARQVTLTMSTTDGFVTVQPRHVWLITYLGLAFNTNLGCTCYLQSQPNTTVVLDGRDGQALMTFGAPD